MTYEAYFRQLYDEFNLKYFAGELEEDIEIIINNCGKCSDIYGMCESFHPYAGFEITLDEELALHHEHFARIILLHEMIHVKLYPYGWHGDRFYDEFLRLAALGAYRGLI